MADNARVRLVLWVATAVVLVAALIAVPVVGDDDAQVRTVAGRSVDTAPAADPASSPQAAGDGVGAASSPSTSEASGPATSTPTTVARAATAPPSAPPSTAAPAAGTAASAPPEDLGSPQDPGPAVPPRPGRYRYKVSDGDGTRDATTTITDTGSTPSERRQLVATRGEGLDTDSDTAWRADGVFVLSTVVSFGPNKGNCDWTPDTMQLRLPIAKGSTWDSSSTCSMTGFGTTPIPLNRRVTGKVLELRRVRVAGQVVDVWAIEGTEHLDGGGQSGDLAGTVLFSPKHGIVVSSSGKGTSSKGTFEYHRDVQNLDPE
ncbi:MAG TPA: hypothetical protein VM143_06745 [Acidimicrobiales bacterium]|nr:hypothetical protein [Acidimicrobiales bacterium]